MHGKPPETDLITHLKALCTRLCDTERITVRPDRLSARAIGEAQAQACYSELSQFHSETERLCLAMNMPELFHFTNPIGDDGIPAPILGWESMPAIACYRPRTKDWAIFQPLVAEHLRSEFVCIVENEWIPWLEGAGEMGAAQGHDSRDRDIVPEENATEKPEDRPMAAPANGSQRKGQTRHASSGATNKAGDNPTVKLRWSDVTIRFIGPQDVNIKVNGKTKAMEHATFDGLGFRSKKDAQPILAWTLALCGLAHGDGFMPLGNMKKGQRDTIRHHMRNLNEKLCEYFQIEGAPVKYVQGDGSVDADGWRAAFKIVSEEN